MPVSPLGSPVASCLVEKLVLNVFLSICHGRRGVIGVVFYAPLLLTACASRERISRVVLLDYEQISHVQESVRAVLAHPETASFFSMGAGETTAGILVCGNVNAKIKSGSTGYQPFRGTLVGQRFTVEKIGDGLTGSDEIRASCLAQGVLF
jgi:hypothetical protein